jgi:hypothetical protein
VSARLDDEEEPLECCSKEPLECCSKLTSLADLVPGPSPSSPPRRCGAGDLEALRDWGGCRGLGGGRGVEGGRGERAPERAPEAEVRVATMEAGGGGEGEGEEVGREGGGRGRRWVEVVVEGPRGTRKVGRGGGTVASSPKPS